MDRRTWVKNAAMGSLGVCGCLAGCKSAPMTGRRQLMLVPEQQEVAMGAQAFADTLKEVESTGDSPYQALVERVGMRLAGMTERTDYHWETRVVASDEQNAFCLPGGKIVVYEGILPICENEAGLAVVMSHEVAHVLARHGGERMSQQMGVTGAQTLMGYVLRNKEQVQRDAWMKAYGMASTYGVILPYSRKHELEADHIGLMLMAKAGYDPTEAPRFWNRFGAASGDKPAEFLSTHPADDRRASDLEKLLPESLEIYRQAAAPIGKGELIV